MLSARIWYQQRVKRPSISLVRVLPSPVSDVIAWLRGRIASQCQHHDQLGASHLPGSCHVRDPIYHQERVVCYTQAVPICFERSQVGTTSDQSA